jgi:hypothetical protein
MGFAVVTYVLLHVCVTVCVIVCVTCVYVRRIVHAAWMDLQMDGWIYRWMDRFTDGWIDLQMDGWIYRWMDGFGTRTHKRKAAMLSRW